MFRTVKSSKSVNASESSVQENKNENESDMLLRGFENNFLKAEFPGVGKNYGIVFILRLRDTEACVKVVVSNSIITDIIHLSRRSEQTNGILPVDRAQADVIFSLDVPSFNDVMLGNTTLRGAFLCGKAKIEKNIFKGMKLAERIQVLINSTLQNGDLTNEETSANNRYEGDWNEEFIPIELGENGKLILKTAYSDESDCSKAVLLFPPDPLMGGASDNNVINDIFNEAAAKGSLAVSFDYRGVVGGSLDGDDMFAWWQEMREDGDYSLVAADTIKAVRSLVRSFGSVRELCLVGYSFGSLIALLAASSLLENAIESLAAFRVICVAPPLFEYEFKTLFAKLAPHASITVITVPDDEFSPASALADMADECGFELKIVEGEDHFLRGNEKELSEMIIGSQSEL